MMRLYPCMIFIKQVRGDANVGAEKESVLYLIVNTTIKTRYY